ncbi:hypothetical protein SEPCBS119000_006301 [Sporothrix epigloea]|uniref:F-box domain-containing protein n=1 Tax=Sporothrix epigloea TaxID=1892477 RepID=A0ABP0E6H0_9PEZI
MSPPPHSGDGADDISSELESFRQQWRAEVKAKAVTSESSRHPPQAPLSAAGRSVGAPASRPRTKAAAAAAAEPSITARTAVDHAAPRSGNKAGGPQTPLKLLSSAKKPLAGDNDDIQMQPRAFDGDLKPAVVATPDPSQLDTDTAEQEPRSALEHYEKAVEKEALGSLGDSVKHYRTAFRMDSTVDKKYKNKHYPAPPLAAAAHGAGPSAANVKDKEVERLARPDASTEPATLARQGPPPTMKELIKSFGGLAIEGAPPPIEGMPPPPCPLAELPDELLVSILRDVALDDVGDFVRLARVCRKLAFLVATEDRIWRRVCVGPEFGFADMHRTWARTIEWGPLSEAEGENSDFDDELRRQRQANNYATTMKLRRGVKNTGEAVLNDKSSKASDLPPVYSSWQRMFRLRPRIRFNGCYISTVNYIRPGQPSASLATWANPVHIVTYFRYLRFFRDGTVISLLTTSEPPDVIHHLTKDLVATHQGGAMAHLPSILMQNALRGRWRMSAALHDDGEDASNNSTEDELHNRSETGPASAPLMSVHEETTGPRSTAAVEKAPPRSPFSSLAAATDAESDLVIETEGVGKYYYRMELVFRTAGKGTCNNKLAWRGFYSYDRLTDDWAEFGLKNDRPFFFSRVRSYGTGE